MVSISRRIVSRIKGMMKEQKTFLLSFSFSIKLMHCIIDINSCFMWNRLNGLGFICPKTTQYIKCESSPISLEVSSILINSSALPLILLLSVLSPLLPFRKSSIYCTAVRSLWMSSAVTDRGVCSSRNHSELFIITSSGNRYFFETRLLKCLSFSLEFSSRGYCC